MEAGKRSVREIFNRGRNLEIPFFQRSYVWQEQQWKRFLEDMVMVSETKKIYFLGSVILKQQETTSDRDSRLTVIDGQQRLTTLNIFMKVLCLLTDSDSDFTETFKKQRDKQIILLHNHNDVSSFNSVVDLKELKEFTGVSDNDQILKAYKYFVENIQTDNVLEKLNFFDIIDNILFVGIDLNLGEDEQQIFDTINSLGVKLTTAELLKNYFFDRTEIDKYNLFWRDVFEQDDDTYTYWDREITAGRIRRTVIDLFFYSFLQIKIQEKKYKVNTHDKIEFSKVENLFESYKRFIKEYHLNKDEVVKEIKEYALIFKDNFEPEIINSELSDTYGIERINAIIFGLEQSTLIPYVLYVLKNVDNEIQKNELFQFLESYIMRRMIVKATTKNYNQLFTDRLINNEILSKDNLKSILSENDNKINYIPSDEDLSKGFNESILINYQAAGIIYMIESKIRNKSKHSTKLLGMNKYSLEHLMPKKWDNKWDKLKNKDDRDFRNFKLKTIGNLAIITQSLNASIREAQWSVKRKGNSKNKGLLHYSGGIETLAPYLEYDVWNEERIQERCDDLFEHGKKIWFLQ
ncbi:Uncharacterized conserved protein, contains ParB-like and HNH nuclease domains [Chryseobacterium taichungense]|uniref:Uncharacterized conserved protein, contains ParB-like and HNH nuclease domains n=1 Tax=Chryseobacterium taichungense TaxID=295069 RepID=A0A1H7WAS5_9FLAO|nr:DUF262 domain-containing protein [Chryseobacterium taichungense]SEM18179.1 Uncharacterized conserved protein, contains ParB-like and HNH nuclease domains [Chryseobacterium taichungense]